MKSSKKVNDVAYNVIVTKAKEIKEGLVVFDMVVNGVTIYGNYYREYVNQKGESGELISLPSYKGRDGKYYNHCFLPINTDIKADIIKQLEELL